MPCTYDRAGNLTDLTDNDGSTGYTYDDVKRPASLTEPGASTPITYTYSDDNGCELRAVTRPKRVEALLDATALPRSVAEHRAGSRAGIGYSAPSASGVRRSVEGRSR